MLVFNFLNGISMLGTKSSKVINDLKLLVLDPDFIALNRKVVTTDLLELFNLKEAEHSKVLAWLLDPSEGHMQRDLFLRYLISAVFQKADVQQLEELPCASEMSLMSFCNMKVMQEVTIRKNKARRIDIFLADPSTKTIIVIERKDGSVAHTGQLADYYDWVHEHYSDWNKVFILSDSQDKQHGENSHERYVQLDDSWLAAALVELMNKNILSVRLEHEFEMIHDFFFGEWNEEEDIFYSNRDSLIKNLAKTHHHAIRFLENNSVVLNGKKQPLISLTPEQYFIKILPNKNEYTAEQLNLYRYIQSFHQVFDVLHGYNEFDLLADEIKTLFPDFYVQSSAKKLELTLSSLHIDGVYWPCYLKITRNGHDESNVDSYEISVSAHKKCPEEFQYIAAGFATEYDFKVRGNWKYKNVITEDKALDLSLDNKSALYRELNKFNRIAGKLWRTGEVVK